jgi:hypothetical protein
MAPSLRAVTMTNNATAGELGLTRPAVSRLVPAARRAAGEQDS